MKRTAITAAAIAMTTLLAACDNSDISPKQPGTTLRAKHADATRTQFDGKATSWSEGDAMTIFINDGTGTDAYTFEAQNPAGGIFHCDDATLDEQTEYGYHAIWPACTTTAGGEVTLNVGAAVQTQNGSSTAHIAALDPLTGQASGKPAETVIEMKHSAVLLKLAIRNATGATVAGIRSIRITAPEGTAIEGEYTFDPATGTINETADKAGNNINLKVAESGELPDGGEFTAWAAAAPFEMAAGDKLTFTVTDTDGRVYGIEKPFDGNKQFPAGRIMSTVLELSAETIAKTLEIDVDFTDPEVYPEGFPDGSSDIENGTYTFAGYPFEFSSKVPFGLRNTTEKYALCFESSTQDLDASIMIPQISSYAPTKISIGIHSTINKPYAKIAIRSDDTELTDWKRTSSLSPIIFELSDTDDTTPYYIKIGKGDNTPYKCRLSWLKITYTIME